jgi:hypothetical protein
MLVIRQSIGQYAADERQPRRSETMDQRAGHGLPVGFKVIV